MATTKTVEDLFEVQNGLVVPPKNPGLGITLRLDVLAEPVAT